MPQTKGAVSHHCPLKGKNKGNCWKPKGGLICTEHQMICPYHTNWYHIKTEACALCTKVVEQALYTPITPTFSKYEQEDAASSRKEEISKQKEEKKKNKKVSNRAERSSRNISHPTPKRAPFGLDGIGCHSYIASWPLAAEPISDGKMKRRKKR